MSDPDVTEQFERDRARAREPKGEIALDAIRKSARMFRERLKRERAGERRSREEESAGRKDEVLRALQEHEPEATEADLDRVEELPDDFEDDVPF